MAVILFYGGNANIYTKNKLKSNLLGIYIFLSDKFKIVFFFDESEKRIEFYSFFGSRVGKTNFERTDHSGGRRTTLGRQTWSYPRRQRLNDHLRRGHPGVPRGTAVPFLLLQKRQQLARKNVQTHARKAFFVRQAVRPEGDTPPNSCERKALRVLVLFKKG